MWSLYFPPSSPLNAKSVRHPARTLPPTLPAHRCALSAPTTSTERVSIASFIPPFYSRPLFCPACSIPSVRLPVRLRVSPAAARTSIRSTKPWLRRDTRSEVKGSISFVATSIPSSNFGYVRTNTLRYIITLPPLRRFDQVRFA